MLAFLAVQYSSVPKKTANSAHGQWLSCIGLVEAIANVPAEHMALYWWNHQKGSKGQVWCSDGCARMC